MNTAEITMGENAETVTVGEFRNRISHLERIVQVDWHACKGSEERARWARSAARIGAELIATTCKRATEQDWKRRESAIERSASLITKVREGA